MKKKNKKKKLLLRVGFRLTFSSTKIGNWSCSFSLFEYPGVGPVRSYQEFDGQFYRKSYISGKGLVMCGFPITHCCSRSPFAGWELFSGSADKQRCGNAALDGSMDQINGRNIASY
jgi:hypothetical protein